MPPCFPMGETLVLPPLFYVPNRMTDSRTNEINVLVVYYSRFGGTGELANMIARGVEEVPGCRATLRTVPPVSAVCEAVADTIPDEGAPYCTLDELRGADGLAVGSPTHFGNMAAPMKYFIDSASSLWFSGDLAGKPAGVFTSTGSMHGGQESTLLSMMVPLLHLGMIIVGLPSQEQALQKTTTGGTPYGPSRLTGSGSEALSEDEKQLGKALGRRLARIAKALKQGDSA